MTAPATLTPSIADRTEIAGVIMLSPKNSDAPKIPSAASTTFARRPPGRARLRIRAISAMIPPSPSLSARITSRTYVMVTMIVTDQKISEMIPKMLSSVHLDRVRIARVENRLDGVQRAGADVPEDNSESTERESPLGGSASVHAHSIEGSAGQVGQDLLQPVQRGGDPGQRARVG